MDVLEAELAHPVEVGDEDGVVPARRRRFQGRCREGAGKVREDGVVHGRAVLVGLRLEVAHLCGFKGASVSS